MKSGISGLPVLAIEIDGDNCMFATTSCEDGRPVPALTLSQYCVCGLPARVWGELWPVLHNEITQLFARSLETGKVPKEWKVAKIVPLQKPKRKNYAVANNYRSISLLLKLGQSAGVAGGRADSVPGGGIRTAA